MFERLADLQAELEKLEARLSEIYASGDQDAAREAGRRHAELKPIVAAYEAYQGVVADLADARELLEQESDPDMRAYLDGEVAAQAARKTELQGRLDELLVPKDPNDGRNVIVEIRGAEGGEEANLWAGDLYRMYQRYAERHGWKLELLAGQPSDMGGYREVTFVVRAPDAWSHMKYEAGVHRVQRVPATESQGRVHTSAATVAVLPEAEEIDVRIDPDNDLEIDVFRSSGPGGQSVNTTDSAVRITHKPTGLVVSCQDEKSQLQNKDKAMRILRARLLQAEQERQQAALSSARRSQVKGGGRSEKIRTYNFKESRVTDHRIKLTVHGLPAVLDGDLDEIVGALAGVERAEQLGGGQPRAGQPGAGEP
jgi:peptide chain release factor 1